MLILCIASVNSIWTWYQTKPKILGVPYYTHVVPRTSYHTAPDQLSVLYHTTPRQTVPYHGTSPRTEPHRTTPYSIGSTHSILYYTLYSTNGLELRYESSNQGKKKRESEWVSRYVTTNQARMVNIQHDDDDDGMKYEIRNTKYEYSI